MLRSSMTVVLAVTLSAMAGCATDPMTAGTSGEPVAQVAATDSRFVTATDLNLGAETGTEVGRRVRALQSELVRLQESLGGHAARLDEVRNSSVLNAQEYYGLVAAISARLQIGTTPGNPILVSQWSEAQLEIETIAADITRLNNLAAQVAADASIASFLIDSVRATYGLSGAVEEDHRQLAQLEDEVNRTTVNVDRLLNEIAEDIGRQTAYVATERANLQTLQLGISNGELYGSALNNRALISAAPAIAPLRAAGPTAPVAGDRPLVLIRFDDPNVEYRQQLYQAISAALGQRPNALFDVIAVSPSSGDPALLSLSANQARGYAESVATTLLSMGLPDPRISVGAAQAFDAAGPEVRVFVR